MSLAEGTQESGMKGTRTKPFATRTAVWFPTRSPRSRSRHTITSYIALQRMAEILLILRDDERAEQFLAEARRVYGRVNGQFWMEDEQFYAIALDPDKQPVRAIASNPGHALAAGIAPPERALAVANRLLADDHFSGWGVRTLSTTHPSYNPFA